MHLAKPCLLRTTPLQFSLQPRILLDITRETGVHIAVGTAPPQDWSEGWLGEGGRMGGACVVFLLRSASQDLAEFEACVSAASGLNPGWACPCDWLL